MKRTLSLLLALLMLVGLLAGCGSAATTGKETETQPAPVQEEAKEPATSAESQTEPAAEAPAEPAAEPAKHVDVLRIGCLYANNKFSLRSQADCFGRMNYNGFVALPFWAFDETGELSSKGCFFNKWEISEDNTELTLWFDTTDLYWHDGEPVTVDDGCIHVTFDRSFAFSFMNQAVLMYYIMPKHIWENVEDPASYDGEDAAIGCGPFKFVSVDKDAQVSYYEAVENYPLGEVMVDKLELHSYDNQSAMIVALQNGEIDAMFNYSVSVDATLLPLIESDPAIDLGESFSTSTYQICFGWNKYPTNDLSFRLAVSKALDYQLLSDTVSSGVGSIASAGAVSPAALGFNPNVPDNAQNIEEANRILDEAGYLDVDGDGMRELPDGSQMDVKIAIQTVNELSKRIAEVLEINLAAVGVRVSVDEQTISNSDYTASLRKDGSYEIYIGTTTVGIAMYTGVMSYAVDSSVSILPAKFGTCQDEAYMAEYVKMINSNNYDAYIESFMKMQEMNAEIVPVIALSISPVYAPYRTDKIQGWINYPSWGVINSTTWYSVSAK